MDRIVKGQKKYGNKKDRLWTVIPILTAISILFAVVLEQLMLRIHAMLVISCDLLCLYNVQCYYCNQY